MQRSPMHKLLMHKCLRNVTWSVCAKGARIIGYFRSRSIGSVGNFALSCEANANPMMVRRFAISRHTCRAFISNMCARARARVCVCVRACVRAERAGAGGKGRGEVPSTTGSLEIFGGGGSRRWCPYRQKINGIREEYGGAGWSAGLWHRWQKNRYDVFMRMARVCQADGAAIAARRISEEKHEIVVPRSRRDRTCFLSPFFASVFTIFPVLLASSSSSSSSSSSLCNKI